MRLFVALFAAFVLMLALAATVQGGYYSSGGGCYYRCSSLTPIPTATGQNYYSTSVPGGYYGLPPTPTP